MDMRLTFSADARRGSTVLAKKVGNFSGSGVSALFASNAAWTAALVAGLRRVVRLTVLPRHLHIYPKIRPDSEWSTMPKRDGPEIAGYFERKQYTV